MMENRNSFDIKYIFNDNIERVWSFIRNPVSLYESNQGLFVSLTSIEGSNLWAVDSIFKLILPTGSEIYMKCIKSTSEPHNKNLCYSCAVRDCVAFDIHYSLFQVSSDNTTVVLIEFDNIKTTRTELAEIIESIAQKTFNTLNNYMQKSTLSLFQNESAIIHVNINQLWDLIFDWNVSKQLTALHVDAFIILESNCSSAIEAGTIFKLIFVKEHEAYFKVKSMDKKEGSSKWEIVFEYLSSSLFYFQELRVILISISSNSTQISVCHHFSVPETPERIQKIGVIKKKILTKLKSIAENTNNSQLPITKQG